MTRAELLELLTVERFTPGPPQAIAPVCEVARAVVGVDDPDVVQARRDALVEEASALWHDDADRVLELLPTPTERSA